MVGPLRSLGGNGMRKCSQADHSFTMTNGRGLGQGDTWYPTVGCVHLPGLHAHQSANKPQPLVAAHWLQNQVLIKVILMVSFFLSIKLVKHQPFSYFCSVLKVAYLWRKTHMAALGAWRIKTYCCLHVMYTHYVDVSLYHHYVSYTNIFC